MLEITEQNIHQRQVKPLIHTEQEAQDQEPANIPHQDI